MAISSYPTNPFSYPNQFIKDLTKIYHIKITPEIRTYISELFDAYRNYDYTTPEFRSQIISSLQELLQNYTVKSSPPGRSDERISRISAFLPRDKFIPASILDIGAGTGDITLALKEYYNLPPTSVFAIDQKLPALTQITPITYTEENTIPLPNNSIDLIILFAVLHHIPPDEREALMKEIYRVLSPNGYVIIREHDDDKDFDFYVYLDLYHILWYITKDETSDPLYLLSRSEISSLFQKYNLHPVNFHTYPSPNPKRMYHEMFKKILPKFVQNSETRARLLQISTLFKSLPPTLESIPLKLRENFSRQYPDLSSNWNLILRQIMEYVLIGATNYLSSVDGVYTLNVESIDRSMADLN